MAKKSIWAIACVGVAGAVAGIYWANSGPSSAGEDQDRARATAISNQKGREEMTTGEEKIVKSDAEWREQLSDMEFKVTREKGTERAFAGEYWDHHEDGVYRCVCCGQPLYDSQTKFDSGTGWPSFYQPVDPANVGAEKDTSFMMVRTEVKCSRCDAHLGHVFDDGPEPTGQRHCINSAALEFESREQK